MNWVVCYRSGVVCSLSGLSLSYNNYDYDNSNTNVSSHLCRKFFVTQTLATVQNITHFQKVAGTSRNATFQSKGYHMKRIGNLYKQIYAMDNLKLADAIARKGKSKQMGIILHDKNREANLLELQRMLITRTYLTSKYTTLIALHTTPL